MLAVTVVPGSPGHEALLDVPEPSDDEGPILCETVAVGVDGTDNDIVQGEYGVAPAGQSRLILGHESLGRVIEAPDEAGFRPGDLLVGVVRRPDPVPCPNCAVGEWDMCRNGRYTERGIKGRHGFLSERFRIEPGFAVRASSDLGRLAVLTEPVSVVAKAWDHVSRIGSRARFDPRRVLITGAGPLGLLAAMLAAQRELDVHVLDVVESGPKPRLVGSLGGTYHTGSVDELEEPFDVVVECTGVGPVVLHAAQHLAADGVMCLTGISAAGRTDPTLDTDAISRRIVLNNNVLFGSVNAGLRHYEDAARALERADRAWLEALVTRWEPLEEWRSALERRPEDVKSVVELASV